MKRNLRKLHRPADTFMVVDCAGWLVGFASLALSRAVLAAEVRVVPSRFDQSAPGEKRRVPPVIVIDGVEWAAWDLGLLLGLQRTAHSWILFELASAGRTLKIALRTGPCLSVSTIEKRSALPPGMFVKRKGAVVAAFLASDASNLSATHANRAGIVVDPAKLWTPLELDSSALALGAADKDPSSAVEQA